MGRQRILPIPIRKKSWIRVYRRRHGKVEFWVCRSCFLPTNSSSLNPWYFTAAISKKPIPLKWGGIRMMSYSPSLRTLCDYPLFGKCLNSFLIPWFQITSLIASSYIHPPVLDILLSISFTEFSTSLGTQAVPLFPLIQKPHWHIWWNWQWCVTHRSRLFWPQPFFETSI